MGINQEEQPPRANVRGLDFLVVFILVGLVVLLIASVVRLYRPPAFSSEVSLERYHRINLGMSRNEVETILGQGTDNTPTPAEDVLPRKTFHLSERFLCWMSKDQSEMIEIHFVDGKVIHKRFWKGLEKTEMEPV
jgi:hypothetical protein